MRRPVVYGRCSYLKHVTGCCSLPWEDAGVQEMRGPVCHLVEQALPEVLRHVSNPSVRQLPAIKDISGVRHEEPVRLDVMQPVRGCHAQGGLLTMGLGSAVPNCGV